MTDEDLDSDLAQPLRAAAVPPPLAPIELDLVPREVVAACSVALHRVGARSLPSLAVTSPLSRDGRTTVTLGAATVQRNEYGRRTVLIELAVDAPRLANRLAVQDRPGLAEYLTGEAPLSDVLYGIGEGMSIMPAGHVRGGEVERLLALVTASDLVPRLAAVTDVVVADLPPLLPDGLAERVVPAFTATLLVVRAGRTPLSAVREAVDRFHEPPPVLVNEFTTRVPRWLRDRSR